MAGFTTFVGLSYIAGILIAASVIRVRAGVGLANQLKILGDRGFGPVWFLTAMAASMFWPVTLVVWLVRGRPEPRIVFNDKAEERHRHAVEQPNG
jgi:hypothetical protein